MSAHSSLELKSAKRALTLFTQIHLFGVFNSFDLFAVRRDVLERFGVVDGEHEEEAWENSVTRFGYSCHQILNKFS